MKNDTLSSRAVPAPHIAQILLNRAHSATTSESIFQDRVKQRPLHLHPTTAAPSTTAQEARRNARTLRNSLKKRQKPAPLSARQRRALGLYDIPRSAQEYSIYEPLNKMWNAYILEVLSGEDGTLNLPVTGQSVARVCAADFHGAAVTVVRCACVGRVGISGIVVKDTRGVFEVVTKGDGLKRLPKEGSIFEVRLKLRQERKKGERDEDVARTGESGEEEINDLILEVHGDQFTHRPADRATKKFRWHFLPNV